MPQSIEMTRQELYDLVWSRSVGAVAASIPMSHVSLRKLCAKHQVPVSAAWSLAEVLDQAGSRQGTAATDHGRTADLD